MINDCFISSIGMNFRLKDMWLQQGGASARTLNEPQRKFLKNAFLVLAICTQFDCYRHLFVGLFEVAGLCQQASDSWSPQREYPPGMREPIVGSAGKSDGTCYKTGPVWSTILLWGPPHFVSHLQYAWCRSTAVEWPILLSGQPMRFMSLNMCLTFIPLP